MTKKKINAAIKHLGLEIQNTRGDGYSYFTCLETEEQAGDSVYVCYMNHQPLATWVRDAEYARKQYDEELEERAAYRASPSGILNSSV
jgi:hypothetical protein